MSTLVTNVPKKEEAIVLLLEVLEGNQKAEKVISDFTAAQLNVDFLFIFYLFKILITINNSHTPQEWVLRVKG